MANNKGARFNEKLIGKETFTKNKTGRNSDLIRARNEILLHRYYYFSKIIMWRFDVVLYHLQYEFFLSSFTLGKLINENAKEIRGIASKKPSGSELKKLFPLWKWDYEPVILKVKIPGKEGFVLK